MIKQTQMNFSHELRQSKVSDKQLESIGHPLLKQVMTEILTNELDDNAFGSSFGEAVVPPQPPNRR